MILGFRSKEAEKIWHGEVTKRLPPAIQIVARRKLRMLNSARRLDDLRIPPANRLEALKGERRGNTASASTNNGDFVFAGWKPALPMSRSWITTEVKR
jgi:plasmid maintenance system killer protein